MKERTFLKGLIEDFILPSIIFAIIFVIGIIMWFSEVQFITENFNKFKDFIIAWIFIDLIITVVINKLIEYLAIAALLIALLNKFLKFLRFGKEND